MPERDPDTYLHPDEGIEHDEQDAVAEQGYRPWPWVWNRVMRNHSGDILSLFDWMTEKADRVGDNLEPNRVSGGEIWSGIDPANVKSYGAVGDGVTDDEAAIEAAVESSNGIIFLPNGTYSVNDPITVDTNKDIKFVGLGKSTIIDGNGTSNVFTIVNAGSVEFENLTMQNADIGVRLSSSSLHSRLKVSNCYFNTIDTYCIESTFGTGYDNLIVEECEFENVYRGIGVREQEINNATIDNNTFRDIGHRAVIVGNSEQDGEGVSITNNTIQNISRDDDEHVIGILCYSNDSTIEGNYFRNIASNGRHEGISVRGRRCKITNNSFINAGGSTAAISLAGGGPCKISNNDIVFSEAHTGSRRAMDCRQREVNVHNNTMRGWSGGIYFRRGARINVHNNRLYETDYADIGINVVISSGTEFQQASMRNININANQFAEITGPGNVKCIHINPERHGGTSTPRLDDVIITDNIINYVGTSDTAFGVQFNNIGSDPARTKNAIVTNNIFSSSIDVAIGEDGVVDNKIFTDNIGT